MFWARMLTIEGKGLLKAPWMVEIRCTKDMEHSIAHDLIEIF